MVDPLPSPQSPGLQPTRPAPADVAGPGRAPDAKGASPGFQALLERIESRARQLAADTDAVEAPEQLAGAVETARESLAEVLDLEQRLLEAYRQQQQQTPPGEGGSGSAE